MSEPTAPPALVLYQTEDGRTRVECRFEGNTLWLTPAQMAELFQTSDGNRARRRGAGDAFTQSLPAPTPPSALGAKASDRSQVAATL